MGVGLMNLLLELSHWFTGGENQYMRLYGCMRHDNPWIALTVGLDLSIAIGYVIIALHWSRNARHLPDIPAKRVLANIRNIFIFCGLCGYLFIPIKMFWPGWRLYDFVLMLLSYSTWRYVFSAANLKVVYTELGRSNALAAELQRSQRESLGKSQFLNALSHDLRTPLNGLSLQASVAEVALEQNDMPALQQALVDMRASTRATAALLNSLLETARADWIDEQSRPVRFALAALLDELAKRAEAPAAAKGLSVQFASPGNIELQMDRTKLDRMLSNLISNAIKFTDAGSIKVRVERSATGVEIHVIDTGIGIAPAVHEHLFDEFFQIQNHERDPSKGFGLGLSIARRLARQMGGDITVESSPGRGSRFSVLLCAVVVSEPDRRDALHIQPSGAAAIPV
jgi:signal transduction histidine kinase